MIRPPLWVEDRSDWFFIECGESFRIRFTCGCGANRHVFVPNDSPANLAAAVDALACPRCWRTERKRLYMRQRRGSDEPHDLRPCGHCGEPFRPQRSTARF